MNTEGIALRTAGQVTRFAVHGRKWTNEGRFCVKHDLRNRQSGRRLKISNEGSVLFASAHDLRRSFGTRWSKRVRPATLQKLMRHADIKTTMTFYVDQDADDTLAEVWAAVANTSQSGATELFGGLVRSF